MILETPRLILREYVPEDFDALYEILSDPETMRHYPKPYDDAGVRRWLDWCFAGYRDFGFSLWAAVLRETGRLIGDCGITMQPIGGWIRPEIGYHIHRAYWRQGLGSEAARAVRDWAFEHTPFETLYSYMAESNEASQATARANGMRLIRKYPDEKNGTTAVYAITRKEWEQRQVILLNGPSSSGKSTLSKALQALIADQAGKRCEVVSIDDFMKTSPLETIYEDDVFEISGDICNKAVELLNGGSAVIIDHVITSERIFSQLTDALRGFRLRLVRVTCPPDVLRRREAERGDRCPGSAESSAEHLFPKDHYDLTVDTSLLTPAECARAVSAYCFPGKKEEQ